MWSPTSSLSDHSLTSAPVWLSLHNVPPPLWSLDGFELIANGVGDPIPSSSASASLIGIGAPRIRAVVPLNKGSLPSTVLVEDDQGFQVPVEICYLNLLPLCPICAAYGHQTHRYPKRTSPSLSAHVNDLPDVAASVPATETSPSLPSTVVKRSARSAAPPPPSPSVRSVRSVVLSQRQEATLGDSKSGPEVHGPPAQSQTNLASKSDARGPPVTSLPISAIQLVSLGPSDSSKYKSNPKSSQVRSASHGPELPSQLSKPNLLLQPSSLQPLLSASPAHSTSTTRPTVPPVDPSVPLVNSASDSQSTPANKTVSAVVSSSASLTTTPLPSSVRPPPRSPSLSASKSSTTQTATPSPPRPTPVPQSLPPMLLHLPRTIPSRLIAFLSSHRL